MAEINPAREAAFASLLKMKCGKYSNLEVNSTLSRRALSDEDKRLYTALTYGTLERLITLDYIISKYSKIPPERLDDQTLCALRLGLYQLCFMDRIPDHAAVSEAVSLAGKRSGGYVNAVLRGFIRGGKDMHLPKKEDKCGDVSGSAEKGERDLERLSVCYSVPAALCRLFVSWYGERETEDIFRSFLRGERVCVHVNTLKISVSDAVEKLGGTASSLCPDTVVLNGFDGVAPGIERGDWFVQDEASAVCASALGALPGDTAVDCCAAPGGKSFAVALYMKNQGTLYSFDIHGNKLSLIESGAEKLGISVIKTEMRDAREPKPELIGKCQKVLCDAPCSGLGIIGKKPEIKYKDIAQFERLPDIQYDILCGASGYTAKGGTLVYSTCTLNPSENEGVCSRFLAEHKDFALDGFRAGERECDGMLTLRPDTDGTDGFFVCRMVRKG